MNRTIEELKSLVSESERILSAHDGIHRLHGAVAGIRCWLRNANDFGIDCVEWENVDSIMETIRITHQTGKYPGLNL